MDTSTTQHTGISASDRRRRLWVLPFGVVLLPLLAMLWVLLPQATGFGPVAQNGDIALAEALRELEAEHLRWRQEVPLALVEPRGGAAARLALHREEFARRIDEANAARVASSLRAEPGLESTLARLKRMASDVDHALAAGSAGVSPQALRLLIGEQDATTPQLHGWLLKASRKVLDRSAPPDDAVRWPARQAIALALAECAILLAAALMALRMLDRARHHHEELRLITIDLRAESAQAKSANNARFALFAELSHEARTPSHGLLGMTSLLHETPLSAQQLNYLRSAEASARQLLSLVNDVIDMSRLESAQLQLLPEAVDLARLVREAEALMREQAQSKGLALEVTMETEMPRWVRADPMRLRQILVNLLGQAITFTEAGHVHLRVEPDAGVDGHTVFTVVDTGIGLDMASPSNVFSGVSVGHGNASRCAGTTGMGLPISRGLARLMDGDITVDSAPGEGCSFMLSLPLPAIDPAEFASGARTSAPEGPGRMLKVLVAEDHPVNRLYLEAVLDKLGHEAVYTENGEEAVRAAQAEDFDIVLMDLHMPLIDGFAAARAIRRLPLPRGAMPIVALTADASPGSRERAREAGMDDAMTKPAHLPQLRALLALYGGAPAVQVTAAPAAPIEGRDDIVDRATVEQLHAALSPQKYSALLARFFDAHEPTLTRLRDMAQRGERSAVWQQTQALRGAALSLGLRAIADRADALMEAADDKSRPALSAPLGALEDGLSLTRSLCQGLGWLRAGPAAGRAST